MANIHIFKPVSRESHRGCPIFAFAVEQDYNIDDRPVCVALMGPECWMIIPSMITDDAVFDDIGPFKDHISALVHLKLVGEPRPYHV